MTELNASTLSQLPPKVAAPPYDRSRLKRGIAHFGVGNFHRAHQAFYIDRCLALPGQEDWGIVGIRLGGGERGRANTARERRCRGYWTPRQADANPEVIAGRRKLANALY